MSKRTKKSTRQAKFKKMLTNRETIYYGVKIGKNPGVYTSWNDVYKETHKFPGAKFKKFDTLEKATAYIQV